MSINRVLFQSLEDDSLHFTRDVGSQPGGRHWLLSQLLGQDSGLRVGAERYRSREHLVEHDAERVDIGLVSDFLPLDLLGSHVVRGAHHHIGAGEPGPTRLAQAGDAKVHQFDIVGRVENHDVLRLDVSMDDARPVRSLQAFRDLRCQPH